jgi:hypothetical protein
MKFIKMNGDSASLLEEKPATGCIDCYVTNFQQKRQIFNNLTKKASETQRIANIDIDNARRD